MHSTKGQVIIVVTKHIIIMTENVSELNIPTFRPMLRTINSTSPRVFMRKAIAALSATLKFPKKYAGMPAPSIFPALATMMTRTTTPPWSCRDPRLVFNPERVKYKGSSATNVSSSRLDVHV